jgi:hypothetical protein
METLVGTLPEGWAQAVRGICIHVFVIWRLPL